MSPKLHKAILIVIFTAGSDIDELCPSMYSFHSDVNEKNILLKHFRDNGIETTVDRQAKKQRIRDWIQNSVIEEGDEDVSICIALVIIKFRTTNGKTQPLWITLLSVSLLISRLHKGMRGSINLKYMSIN